MKENRLRRLEGKKRKEISDQKRNPELRHHIGSVYHLIPTVMAHHAYQGTFHSIIIIAYLNHLREESQSRLGRDESTNK